MAKSRPLADAVAEDLDVFGDLAPGRLPSSEAAVMHPFGLPGSPATFHRCVVSAISLAGSLMSACRTDAGASDTQGDNTDCRDPRGGSAPYQAAWRQRPGTAPASPVAAPCGHPGHSGPTRR